MYLQHEEGDIINNKWEFLLSYHKDIGNQFVHVYEVRCLTCGSILVKPREEIIDINTKCEHCKELFRQAVLSGNMIIVCLAVLENLGRTDNGEILVRCWCSCGNTNFVCSLEDIVEDRIRSCCGKEKTKESTMSEIIDCVHVSECNYDYIDNRNIKQLRKQTGLYDFNKYGYKYPGDK